MISSYKPTPRWKHCDCLIWPPKKIWKYLLLWWCGQWSVTHISLVKCPLLKAYMLLKVYYLWFYHTFIIQIIILIIKIVIYLLVLINDYNIIFFFREHSDSFFFLSYSFKYFISFCCSYKVLNVEERKQCYSNYLYSKIWSNAFL